MKIAVIGLQHLGIVTAVCLAKEGFDIIGFDEDKEKLMLLNHGISPVSEQGLETLIQEGFEKENLHFVSDNLLIDDFLINDIDVIWFTYDTPVNKDDIADISYVIRKIEQLIEKIEKIIPIIISSQLPVGTIRFLEKKYPKHIFISIPENLRHGTAVKNFMNPDRVVIGIRKNEHYGMICTLFRGKRIVVMDIESAEFVKHAINAFIAMEIVFANELGNICERLKIDYNEVLRGLLSEERIGDKARLRFGKGYSGGTLARDINYLIGMSSQDSIFSYIQKSNKSKLEKENET